MVEFEIRRFEPETATEADFVAINAFDNRMRAEAWPDDPPAPLEQTRLQYRPPPAFVGQRTWFAWRGAESVIAGQAGVALRQTPQNRHAAWAWCGVEPGMRRRGLGASLLRLVVEAAREDGRRLLIGTTSSQVAAGEAFMESMGASRAMASYTNQLAIEELNRQALQDWLGLGPSLDGDFELVLVEGLFPEDQLEAIAALMAVMDTAPREDLDLEDSPPTVEQLREVEARMAEGKSERWMMYVRDRASGRLAGYTEVFWDPSQPHVLQQSDTGVFPEFRNRGLGKWLKASMLEKVLRERPQVRYVRTGNAQSNVPMLRINNALGFKPYRVNVSWQVPLERVEAWLAARPALDAVRVATDA